MENFVFLPKWTGNTYKFLFCSQKQEFQGKIADYCVFCLACLNDAKHALFGVE